MNRFALLKITLIQLLHAYISKTAKITDIPKFGISVVLLINFNQTSVPTLLFRLEFHADFYV